METDEYVMSEGVEVKIRSIHCDPRILHAPRECVYCDSHGLDLQALRLLRKVNFTGRNEEGCVPCPADAARGDAHQEWGGNVAKTEDDLLLEHREFFKSTLDYLEETTADLESFLENLNWIIELNEALDELPVSDRREEPNLDNNRE